MQNAPFNENQNPYTQGQTVNNTLPEYTSGQQGNCYDPHQNNMAGQNPLNNNGFQPTAGFQGYQNQQPQNNPPFFAYYPPTNPYAPNGVPYGYQNQPIPPQPTPPPNNQYSPYQPPFGAYQQPYQPNQYTIPPQPIYSYTAPPVNPYAPQGYMPYIQPVYYVPVPMAPQPIFQTEEDVKKSFEKKAVKKTSNRIGLGIILFYIVSLVFSFLLTPLNNFKWGISLLEDPAFNLVLNMVITLVGFLLAAFFIFKTEKSKPHRLLSYGPPKKGLLLPAIMTGLGFCYVANIVTSLLQTSLSGILPFAENNFDMPQGVFGFLLSLLSVAVFPAILEEFLFRGAIMGSLLKFGKPFAIFVSAAIFGLIHGNLVQIPFAFMVGLVIGFLVIETDSIWTGVIIHFLNNAISVCIDYLGTYIGEDILTAAYMILLATIIMVGFFGIYILSLKNKDLFKYSKVPHISTAKQKVGWLCSSAAIIVFFVIVGLEIGLLELTAGMGV